VPFRPLGLRLGRIEDELIDVQRHFPAINAVLNLRRDDFTDVVRQNMIAAYEFLDAVVQQSVDLFSDEGLEALLQLNHLVLLGRGYDARAYGRHISTTRKQFFANFSQYVKPIRQWYRKHGTENPYKVAAQVYVGVLSQPQLYQEGNHRTGSLIASGILLQNGCAPFVLTRQNAVAYFNPSSEIKFTDKRTVRGKLRLPKYRREFRTFLSQNVDPKYVRRP
jgi:prophage maintenance system killer protein